MIDVPGLEGDEVSPEQYQVRRRGDQRGKGSGDQPRICGRPCVKVAGEPDAQRGRPRGIPVE
jgi:hypothetical protein